MQSSVVDLTSRFMKRRAVTLSSIGILVALIMGLPFIVMTQAFVESEKYIHDYFDSPILGNWTYLEKPVFPVLLHEFQVPIGQNWSIVCPLLANNSYHVYIYGKWVDNSSTPKTDYDIYVYNYLGEMESYHTEAAGLPEHLGTTVDDAFFVPRHTGNYTFVIVNDPRESKGAQEATFMLIEDLECNAWQRHYVEGKDSNDTPVLGTSWAYEFVTESRRVEVFIKVPETLDMYEARLYLMYDPTAINKSILNEVPLAWELGLYGNRSSANNMVGGYNVESKEYRGVAYASCEFYGQGMFLNFTSPFSGKNLFHLVFIGEKGSGTIDFLVKTEFNNANLKPSIAPKKIYPTDNVTVSYMSNSSTLKNASLTYSIDSWTTTNTTNMEISNETCTGVIPGQVAGATVNYEVRAFDFLENMLTANGSYSVKYDSLLNWTRVPKTVAPNENFTVEGRFAPEIGGIPITVYLSAGNVTRERVCFTLENGTFKAELAPDTVGTWVIYAECDGSSSIRAGESPLMTIVVEEAVLAKYSYYIFGAVGAIIAIGMGLFVRKSRG
jgi:hypothetical protein